jgi:hypothetical protein
MIHMTTTPTPSQHAKDHPERRAPRDWLATLMPERAKLGEILVTRGESDEAGAIFDTSRDYRYAWWRTWRANGPTLLVVTLDSHKADESYVDKPSRMCVTRAQTMGYGSVWIGNLFALRRDSFNDVRKHEDPIGPANDWWLTRLHTMADATLVAWGDHGRYLDRGRVVLGQLLPIRGVLAFGATAKLGEPHHLAGIGLHVAPSPFAGIRPEAVHCRKCGADLGTAEGTVEAKLVLLQHEHERHPLVPSFRAQRASPRDPLRSRRAES